jgi:hypothetical protein
MQVDFRSRISYYDVMDLKFKMQSTILRLVMLQSKLFSKIHIDRFTADFHPEQMLRVRDSTQLGGDVVWWSKTGLCCLRVELLQ